MTVVRTVYGDSKSFEIKVGMHQGSALSPLFFMIVMEAISREFRVALPWDVSLIMRRRLYSTMVRWMCGVKLKDRLPTKELRERLGIDDIALVLQQNRLRWYGHVLQKDDDDWVKKCLEYEVEGPRPRGRPKRTWREVVRKDCQAL